MRCYLYFILLTLLSVVNWASAQDSYTQTQKEPQQATIEVDQNSAAEPEKTAAESTTKNTEIPPPPPVKVNPRATIKVPAPIEKWHQNDLHYYEDASVIKPLLIGETDFITIREEEVTGNPKGIAIIVPDWQQHLANPKSMTQFRHHLPEHGWHLIGLQPPTKPANYPATELATDEQKKAEELALSAYKQALTERIKLVMDQARDYPGVIIVIAEGVNAALLADIFATKKVALPSAFVSISAYMPSVEQSLLTAKALALTPFPVLDVYLDQDNYWVKHSAPMRKAEVRKGLKPLFRQRKFHSANARYPDPELSKQVFSWIMSLGW